MYIMQPNRIVDGINSLKAMESLTLSAAQKIDSTPVKVTRHVSVDSLEKSTCIPAKCDLDCRSSPVSVANVFDDDYFLQSMSSLPYSECDDEFDDAIDHAIAHERNAPHKKRVRFQVDEDGDIDEGVCLYSFPDYKLTPKLIKECWYRKEDRVQSKLEIQRRSSEHRTSISNSDEYREAMVAAIAFLVRCDDDAEDETQLSNEVLNAMTIIVQADTRGMERPLQFHMGLPRISTKTNVHAVLQTQTLIRELDSSNYDEFEVEELIADQCMNQSQYGIRWAKMIAQGDAEDARKNYKMHGKHTRSIV
jgi:hypothetical protein